MEHRELGDRQTEKSKTHSLYLPNPKRFLDYLSVLARAAAQDPVMGMVVTQRTTLVLPSARPSSATLELDPLDNTLNNSILGLEMKMARLTILEDLRAVERALKPSRISRVMPMRSCPGRRGATGNARPNNVALAQEMMLIAAGRPTGKRKRMCQDRLDALSENDVPQLKTVRVEPMAPG